jgi:hypothetical protein
MGVEPCFLWSLISCPVLFWYECLSAHVSGPLVMQSSYVSSLYLCVFIFDSNIDVLEPCFEDVTQAKASVGVELRWRHLYQ